MRKLNNKGFTTVEVIICFVIIVIISTSLYTSITSFNEKRIIEGYKEQIYIYKNTLTKEIQDDFIKIGLSSVTKEVRKDANEKTIYTLNCTLKDGTTRKLIVTQRLGYSSYHTNGIKKGANADDYFMIEYGTPDDLIQYPLPELGNTTVKTNYNNSNIENNNGTTGQTEVTEHTVKDFSINNIQIKIKDENLLSIYIGFYHPELSTRYAISINAPINYTATSSSSNWNYGYN